MEFEADGTTLLGYLSRPALPGPHPAVLVVHENRGLLPHFEDVTRRLAREGYVALAVDMLSRAGGTNSFADTNAMLGALRGIPTDQIVADGNSGVRFLQEQPCVKRDRVGALGFCFGGGIVWLMAVGNPELRAAVPFYGSAPPLEGVPGLQVPVLGSTPETTRASTRGFRAWRRRWNSRARNSSSRPIRGPVTHSSTIPAADTTPRPPQALGWKPWTGSKTT